MKQEVSFRLYNTPEFLPDYDEEVLVFVGDSKVPRIAVHEGKGVFIYKFEALDRSRINSTTLSSDITWARLNTSKVNKIQSFKDVLKERIIYLLDKYVKD